MTHGQEAQIRALYRDIREGRLGRAEAEAAIRRLRDQSAPPLRLRHDDPYLRDHTIDGAQVVIGVTYAALAARRFLALHAPLTGVRLRRLLFVDPVQVAPGMAVALRTEIAATGACTVAARREGATDWVAAATCQMEALTQPAGPPSAAVETTTLTATAAEALYEANPYVVWGPSFKTIATAAASASEAVLHLHLPVTADPIFDPAQFALDPRVLNGVLLGAFAMLTQRGQACSLLPLSVGVLDIFAAPSSQRYRVAVHRSRLSEEMLTVAAEITDDAGRIVAVWRDFGLKRMTQDGARRSASPPHAAASPTLGADAGGEVRAYLETAIARVLGRPITDGARNLLELGLESRHLIALADELRQELEIDLLPTVFFEYPSLDTLTDHFNAHFRAAVRRQAPPPLPPAAQSAPAPPARSAVTAADAPIAIIGMAGRLAQSPDLERFWDNMAASRAMITEVPSARWDADEWFDSDREAAHKSYCKWGSFIEDIAAFDPLFFNISPQQALWLDPQARHLLEAAYHAAEDAGCSPRLRGSRTGVFAGVCFQEYWDEIIRHRITLTGHEHASSYRSSVAAHISYALDLRGPSLPLDNACASSLSALHLACQSLRLGECEMAFACGVNLLISPLQFVYFSRIQAMSASGRCHTFDRRADGFVPGEGAIALLLKPLDAAQRDGDPIHAVIRGSAINHVGRSPNPTAPRPEMQTEVLRLAWERAGIAPQDLSYIECHGTGTQLGDPIEINALKKAFGAQPGRAGGCVIGSVKAHIGHLEGAAGLAGVVKVVQSMKHGQLLRMPQFQDLNPMIQLDGSPLRILRQTERWDDSEGPRIAGVSGFGMTGNGAHVVLQAYAPPAARADAPHAPQLILLSAKDDARLRAGALALRAWLDEAGAAAWLPDIAHSLQVGREAFDERLAFIARDTAEMRQRLDAYLTGAAALGQSRIGRGATPPAVLCGDTSLDMLRDAWLAGAVIDWAALATAADPAPRRISLPGYAFAREPYWFTTDHCQTELAAPAKLPAPAKPPATPLVNLDDLLIQPVWQETPLAGTAAPARIRHALLVAPRPARALAEMIAASLPSSLILAAEEAALPGGLDGLLTTLDRFDAVFFLAGVADPGRLATSQTSHEILALRLAQALGKARGAALRRDLFFLLANSFPTRPEPANPAGAGLCGLAYALAQSDPRLAVRNIDLGAAAHADRAAGEALVAAILREPADPRGDLVRLDAGVRYRRVFEPVALPPSQGTGLREGGVYVIVGGAGTVSSVLTPWLIKTYQARVVWIGRRPRQAVAACAATGGVLDYVQADATDPAQMRAAVADIRRRHGTIHGAIYAPVVFSFSNAVAETSEAAFSAILDVKTQGSIGFYDAFKDCALDFLCFFSSCQSFAFSGAARLSAYAAGICFADSFAAAIAPRARFPVGVINWGFWRAFTAGALWRSYQEQHPQAATAEHIGFLEDAEGIACFERFVARLRAPELGKAGLQLACLRQSAAVRDLLHAPPAPVGVEPPAETMAVGLRDRLAQLLGEVLLMPAERIAEDAPFAEYGIDSITSTAFVGRINAALGCAIGATTLYDHPTLAALTAHLADVLPHHPTVAAAPQADALPVARPGRDAIAVIGMALQVPGAETPEAFWALLRDGAVMAGPLPAARFADAAEAERYHAVRAGCLDRRDVFDPLFFHISPREAEEMSPYQRLMLQEAWRCLEDGGCNPKTLAESETGVFIGAEPPSFGRASLTGGSEALIAARIAYFLNLKGPALVVNTGCSSSAVALHLACESLRRGESHLALAGGIFADLGPEVLRLLSGIGMISPSGVCRPFDARADGTVISEGLAMLALKRLEDAVADGDPIRGVIIASAMNQDGASNGITAPNGRAQEAVLRKIYHAGGIDPASIAYVEAHGTGTILGDPIEVNALGRVFAEARATTGGCRLGSAKANIGHASAAAGAIGLIKILLSMAHETVPALPGFETPNPKIDLAGWKIAATPSPWPHRPGRPRRAALNSFGHSGTNVHLVVEEAMNADDAAVAAGQPQLVPLSAGDRPALRRQVEALHHHLTAPDLAPPALASLAWTLQAGRMARGQRVAFLAPDIAALRAALSAYLSGAPTDLCWQGQDDPGAEMPDRLTQTQVVARAQEGDGSALARHWVSGGAIDWAVLHAVPPRRVNLPASVFAEMTFPAVGRLGAVPSVPSVPSVASVPETPAPQPKLGAAEGLMRLPVWRPQAAPPATSLAPTAVTILYTPAGAALADAIAARELALGSTLLRQDLAPHATGGAPGRVYVLAWAENAPAGLLHADCEVETTVLAVIQHLRRAVPSDAAIDLFMLTWGATGPDAAPVRTSGAGAAGLAYALAQSDHRFRVRNLDLSAPLASCAAAIMAEPASHRGERLRLGPDGRFGMTFPRLAPVPADVPSGLRQGGTYVIAGGAGTVGSVITRFLIRDYQARVVWLGRSAADAAKVQARLAAFADVANPPLYLQADVTDAPSVTAAIAQIRQRGWRINGAIFSSLVFAFDDGLDRASDASFREIVGVKLAGGVTFCRALAREALDFLCFFSSGQAFSFSGATQFASYAAAMTAADSWALRLAQEQAFPVGIVNWGFWKSSVENERLAGSVDFIEDEAGFCAFRDFTGLLRQGRARQVLCLRASAPVLSLMAGADGAADLAPATVVTQPWLVRPDPALPSLIAARQPADLDGWMARLLLHKLQEMGGLPPGMAQDSAALECAAGILPKYRRWLQEALGILQRQGLIDWREGAARCDSATDSALAVAWSERAAEMRSNPHWRCNIDLLDACLASLPQILRGTLPATDILFPGGSADRVAAVYSGNALFDSLNGTLAQAVAAFLDARLAAEPGARSRIIEIGAGTGGTTKLVLPQFGPRPDVSDYVFTDLSRSFLIQAEARFKADYPSFKTDLWNIEHEAKPPRIADGAYDVVIATNVLHATRRMAETLRHAKSALKAGGLLLINEITRKDDFGTLTFGLLDGWWLYDDAARRVPGSPLLSPASWSRLLVQAGFTSVRFLAGDPDQPGYHVIAAISDGILLPADASAAASPRSSAVAAPPARDSTMEDRPMADGTSLTAVIRAALSEAIKLPPAQIGLSTALSDYGVDSILGISFIDRVNATLGLSLNPAIVFEHATVERLARHVATLVPPPICAAEPAMSPAGKPSAAASKAPAASAEESVIAVIGMAGQFPDATDIASFWRNARDGHDAVRDLPPAYLAGRAPEMRRFTWGGVLADRDCFDPMFFAITPREAESMSPHQRLVMQEGWKALEDAAIDPRSLDGKPVGLFVGAEPAFYLHQSFSGQSDALVASRLAYLLNLRGPALVVNTGCSSSGVALHLACESLRRHETDLALAGGVCANLDHADLLNLLGIGMLSPTGRCHSFSAEADGTVMSEAVGMVVLKRLEDALRDGDPVHACLVASGVNQDGASNGITAPNGEAQEALIRQTYARFGIRPETIDYVEAHGTGTPLGDVVEANALTRAFAHFTDTRQFCAVGSAKSFIGHSSAASGVVGLIHIAMAMRHATIPGLLHFQSLNPLIEGKASALQFSAAPRPWQKRGHPRTAALNCFGHSGSNAHFVLREADPLLGRPAAPAGLPVLVPLSARNEIQLREAARRLHGALLAAGPGEPAGGEPPLAVMVAEEVAMLLGVTAGEISATEPLLDMGAAAADLVALHRRLEQRLDRAIATADMAGWTSVAAIVAAVTAAPEGLAATPLDLASVAMTLQSGRTPMAVRAIFLVTSLAELRDKLMQLAMAAPLGEGCWMGRADAESDLLSLFGSDEDLSETIGRWAMHGRLDKVAAAWSRGMPVDWRRLQETPAYQGARRLHLPTYPFARERYRKPPTATIAPRANTAALGSALLHDNVSDLRGLRFASAFAASDDVLCDHRVGARTILPAAAAIEMAAAAAVVARRASLAGLSLRNLAWSRRMEVAEAALTVLTQVSAANDEAGLHVDIADADGATWFCADALWETAAAAAADLPRLQQRYPLPAMMAPAFYDAVTQSGVDLGPRFRLVTAVHRAETEAGCLARLTLPEALDGSLGLYGLHPCLIDAALQTVLALQGPQTGPMLPFAIDRVDIHADTRGLAVGDGLFAWSRPGAAPGQVDIDLLSAAGLPLVILRGIMMRPAQMETQTASGTEVLTGPVLLAPVWTMLPRGLPVAPRRHALLVAGAVAGAADRGHWGADATLLAVSLDHTVHEIRARLDALGSVAHILWLAPQAAPCAVTDGGLIAQQQGVLLPFFRFVKAALQAGLDARVIDWTIVTRGGAAVVAGEAVDPGHASLHGLVGSLAKEVPDWRFRTVDLGWEEAARPGLAGLLAAPPVGGGEPVALRSGDWFIREWVPIERAAAVGEAPAPSGVIVVIGGAGGIGAVWSAAMIRRHAARIVWIGRRACDAGIQALLAQLGEDAPAPVYVQADAADPIALQAAVARIRAEHGPIRGLVHSAIVLADQTVMKMTEAQLQAALRPKVDVCVRMAQAFAAEALEFVLFFSSVQSFLTMPGQGNYAAGSCFIDGFAEMLRQAWPCQVKVMNWGYWGGVGIVSAPAYRERMQAAGMGSIEPEQAWAALDLLFAGGCEQIALMTADKALQFDGLAAAKRLRLPAPQASVLSGLTLRLPETGPEIDYIRAGGDFRMAMMEPFLRDIVAAQLRALKLTEDAVPHAYLRRWLAQTPSLLAAVPASPMAEAPSLAAAWQAWDAAKPAWLAQPSQQAQVRLVEIALRALPDILSGARSATSVLMPEASLDLVEAVYRNNLAAHYFNLVLAEAVAAVVQRLRAQAPSTKLRLLEIGAGTGATSALLFRMLAARGFAPAVEAYLYTDISHAFLAHAQDRFGPDVPYLRTARLDIDRSLAAQGVSEGGYDIVIAANSLHTTRDVRRAVCHAKSALRPGGVLLLNEISGATLYGHLTFGLLEGWWLFDEPGLRIPGCPGLSPAAWTRVLRQAGFSTPLFPAAAHQALGLQIILAESDGILLEDCRPAVSAPMPRVVPPAAEPERRLDAPLASGDLLPQAISLLTGLIAEVTRIPAVEILPAAAFEAYGIDSIVVIDLAKRLRQIVPDASTTLFFEHQSVAALAQHLVRSRATDLASHLRPAQARPAALAMPQSVRSSPFQPSPKPTSPVTEPVPVPSAAMAGFPVAVIGLAGRYPQAASLEGFWVNLAEGRNCITEVPAERWAWQDYFDPQAGKPGAISTRFGGFIAGIDRFDPLFFGIAPVEAETINPQERLFLQIAWDCIEEAGYTPEGLSAQGKVGVFVGVMNDTYHRGAKHWSVANRVSYHCNFQGPSLAVDTACSSSLTALHLAVESLQGGSCASALVGGVNLITNPLHSIGLSGMRVLAQDDRNKTFAADADGFVDGEGVGAVLLKPLAQAIADGDHIHGIIRGSAINAGGKVNGYTVPNPHAQAEVVAEALARAHVHPRTISYLEAHGTGTVLGDPIEVAGLAAAFARQTDDTGFCAIGAVKSNIGHGESSAGMAGLTKILLQMRYGQLVPSLHAEPLNPEIDFARTPFRVQTELAAWEPEMTAHDGAAVPPPRRAGLSSFGAGGANAHVVIEEYRAPARGPFPARPCLLPLSARTAAQLRQQAANLRQVLADRWDSLADIGFTLQQGRVAFEHRLAIIAADPAGAVALLDRFLAGETSAADLLTGQVKGASLTVPAPVTEDLQAQARAWTAGAAVDWQRLEGMDSGRRRVSLPSYPFAEERCWAPDLPVPPALAGAQPAESAVLRRTFALTGDEEFLRDHRVAGAPVLPGVAYLGFAWQSLVAQFGAQAGHFADVVWSAPFRPQAGQGLLQFEMTATPGAASPFSFTSLADGKPLLHCQGQVAWSCETAPEAPRRDLAALAAACRGRRITPEQLQAVFRRLGVDYGPSHLALGPVALGANLALAPLAAPDQVMPLHPGLLDSAFQAGLCLIDGIIDDPTSTDVPLPFALRHFQVFCPQVAPAWVHVARQAETAQGAGQRALDLELLAADGSVVLRFGGVSSRAVARAAPEATMDRLLAALVRHALPEPQAVLPFYRPWLAQTATFLAPIPASTLAVEALWREWHAHRDGWLADPNLRPRLHLLEAVLPALAAVLTGARRATDVLFPNASLAFVEPIYRDNPTADAFNTVLADSVARFVAERRAEPGEEGLRILELGAGTGGTTRHVLAHLQPFQAAIRQYCYTDRSQVFLNHGEAEFGPSHPFFTCQLLDIEQPIAAQGLTEAGFDVVIAANVLHATRDMRATMRQVRHCLRDGGLLVLNELSGNALYAHVSFGLLEGWWRYDDPELRLSGSPGLSPESWARILAEEGFEAIAFPAATRHALGQQIVCARAGHPAHSPALPDDEAEAQDAYALSLRRTIRAHVARSLKLAEDRIEDDRSFSDYGVDSILAVNLVNDIAEAVNAPLITTVVFDHNTVERLTQHILQTYPALAPARVAADQPPALRFDAALRGLLAAIEAADPQPRETVLLLTERPDLAELAERLGQERALDLIVGASSAAMTPWLSDHRHSRCLAYDGPDFGARLLAFNQQRKVDHIICALPDVDDDLDVILRDGGQWLDVG